MPIDPGVAGTLLSDVWQMSEMQGLGKVCGTNSYSLAFQASHQLCSAQGTLVPMRLQPGSIS